MRTDSALFKALGDRIARLREGKKLTQEALAARATIHRTYLIGLEKGKFNPSVRILSKIARALGVSIRTFFDE